MIHLVNYLKDTKMQGVTMDPESNKSFEVYADADYCGNWHRPTAGNDPRTAKSRTGYAILYAVCLVIWCSKLKTQIVLSTREAEYISLSQPLCNTIPMMQLLREKKANGFPTLSTIPELHCRASEENSGALELACTPKIRPRTKHINQVYHHFQDFVRNDRIQIFAIESVNQISDIFKKILGTSE